MSPSISIFLCLCPPLVRGGVEAALYKELRIKPAGRRSTPVRKIWKAHAGNIGVYRSEFSQYVTTSLEKSVYTQAFNDARYESVEPPSSREVARLWS